MISYCGVHVSNVSLTEFDDTVLANRLAKIRQLDEHCTLVIGTTAAVDVRYKGQQYVIQALGKLKKQGIERFQYQLVGGGDQSYLKTVAEKHGVQDKVKMLGAMPHDKVFEWLDSIDVYVQPSMTEGLPRALIEAMSRACPSIGSDAGGIPELLDQNVVFCRGLVDEICALLKKMDKARMLHEAEKNYEKSKKYGVNLIGKRRAEFFKAFPESVDKRND